MSKDKALDVSTDVHLVPVYILYLHAQKTNQFYNSLRMAPPDSNANAVRKRDMGDIRQILPFLRLSYIKLS